MRTPAPPWLAPALLFGLGAWAWGFVLGLPITGTDAWPILHQAQRALDDPGLFLREPYLDDVSYGGAFWRPAFVGFFSLHWAAFEDFAPAYHVTRLLLYFATACLCGHVAARRGGKPWLGWWLAAAFYLFHPLHAANIPAVSRSAHVLFDLSMLGTIALLSSPGRLPLALGAALSLVAPGICEPALIAPVVGVLMLEPWRERGSKRVVALALAVGLALHVVARTRILGSLGSYGDREKPELAALLAPLAEGLTQHPWGPTSAAALGLVIAGLGLGLLGRKRDAASEAPSPSWRLARRGCVLWLVLTIVSSTFSARVSVRHASYLLCPCVVLLASHVAALVDDPRVASARTMRRVALGATTIGLALVLVPRSPLWRRFPQWEVIGRTSERVIATARSALEQGIDSQRTTSASAGIYDVRASHEEGHWTLSIAPLPRTAAFRPRGRRDANLPWAGILQTYSIRSALLVRGHAPSLRVEAGELHVATLEDLDP